MTLFKSSLALLLLLVFTACMGGGPRPKPTWTEGLYESPAGKAFGVGAARFNVRGHHAQKQEAMAQAIDIIARQKGVKVENSLERIKQVDSGQVSRASSIAYSFQSVNGTKVNAKIKDLYHDKYHDIYYVLMVEE